MPKHTDHQEIRRASSQESVRDHAHSASSQRTGHTPAMDNTMSPNITHEREKGEVTQIADSYTEKAGGYYMKNVGRSGLMQQQGKMKKTAEDAGGYDK